MEEEVGGNFRLRLLEEGENRGVGGFPYAASLSTKSISVSRALGS